MGKVVLGVLPHRLGRFGDGDSDGDQEEDDLESVVRRDYYD